MTNKHIVIIGGGIMGQMAAYYLSQHPQCQITLLDKSRLGQEASWAGGGIVSPLYPWRYSAHVSQGAMHAQRLYPRLCTHLKQVTEIDPQWHQTGMLFLSPRDRYPALQWASEHQQPMDDLTRAEFNHIQPHLNSHITSALWMPHVANVRNPRLLRALQTYLSNCKNVTLHEQTEVLAFKRRAQRIISVATEHRSIEADHFLVTAGAWSTQLLQSLGVVCDVLPVKGQMLLLDTPPGFIKRIILHRNSYLIPRQDGQTLVGSTLEYVGFDKHITQEARDQLWRNALDMMPDLSAYKMIKQWAGLRPGHQAGSATEGAVSGYDNLTVCAGHFRNGLLLAPSVAQRMSRLIYTKLFETVPEGA